MTMRNNKIKSVSMKKKVELDLSITRVEYRNDSWDKHIHLINNSTEDMIWNGNVVNEFYIKTTDLLDLESYAEYEIFVDEDTSYDIYDNEIIKALYDREDNHFMDALQLSLIEYLIENKIPAYYLDIQIGEGDGYLITDDIEDGIFEGVIEDEVYYHPSMRIEWKLVDDILYMNNPIINMEFNINNYDKYPYNYIYSEFAENWNKNINGKYDWNEGNFEEECTEEISEFINNIIER